MSYDTILAKSPGIIYRPGGVAGGLVVTTWTEVQAFVALRQGAVTVYVDDSIVSPAHVPAASGVTDFFGRGELRPYRQDALNYSTLVVDSGATLKGIFRLAGTIEVFADTQGAVPAFDFDYTVNVLGTVPQPALFLDDAAFFGNTVTATQPAIVVPNDTAFLIFMTDRAGFFMQSAAVLVHTTNAASTFSLNANTSEVIGFGSTFGNLSDGPGITQFQFDSSTLNTTLSPVPPVFSTATTTREQLDTHQVTVTFLASAANVLGTFNLPATGTIHVKFEGFGGTGGGGGGQGGGAGPGVGGGGSGGSQYQLGSFDHNLAHPLNITVGAAGAPGVAGAAGGGAGTNGGDGGATLATDPIANVTLFVLQGSSGGQGGAVSGGSPGRGGATYPGGTLIPSVNEVGGPPYGSGFIAAGGKGGLSATAGLAGQRTLAAALIPGGGNFWAPGTGGASAVGEGGGGGGGGSGIFAPAGPGGDGAAVGSNPGVGAAPNSGAGVGGGSGGAGAADPGGAGATGVTGWARISFIAF